MSENDWWNQLQGEEVENNAYGVPHYDVESVADFIEGIITGRTVLDLGCGPGRLGHILARRNPWAIFRGIDVSATMVDLASTDAPLNWFAEVNDGQTIPNELFDDAYSVTVFQHTPSDVVQSYMAQVYNQLTPGGSFVFTYATGVEDTFLSHQTSCMSMIRWLEQAGFEHCCLLETPPTHPNWNWALGTK